MITSRRVRWAGHVALVLCRPSMRVQLVSEGLEGGDHMVGSRRERDREEVVCVDGINLEIAGGKVQCRLST